MFKMQTVTKNCGYCQSDIESDNKTWFVEYPAYYGKLYFCSLICLWRWCEKELFDDIRHLKNFF